MTPDEVLDRVRDMAASYLVLSDVPAVAAGVLQGTPPNGQNVAAFLRHLPAGWRKALANKLTEDIEL